MNIKDFKTQNNEEQVKQTYDKYKNFSQDQLMQELLKTVSIQKQNGTFDKQQLTSTLSLIMPSLTKEQQERIQALLNNL
jgi:hypothetical protein